MSVPNITSTLVVDTLNDLMQTCHEGREGYQRAAQNVDNPAYKTLFRDYAGQRAQFALKLGNILVDLGHEPIETDGGFMAALHRGWINIRSAFSGNEVHTLLEECERGEDAAKSAYEGALDKALPGDIRGVIHDQYEQIVTAHDRIRDLREMKKNNR